MCIYIYGYHRKRFTHKQRKQILKQDGSHAKQLDDVLKMYSSKEPGWYTQARKGSGCDCS